MEENKIIENEATEAVEEKKKGFNPVDLIKKHWKKVVVIGIGAAAYLVGKKAGEKSASNLYDGCDLIEADFSEVDTIE